MFLSFISQRKRCGGCTAFWDCPPNRCFLVSRCFSKIWPQVCNLVWALCKLTRDGRNFHSETWAWAFRRWLRTSTSSWKLLSKGLRIGWWNLEEEEKLTEISGIITPCWHFYPQKKSKNKKQCGQIILHLGAVEGKMERFHVDLFKKSFWYNFTISGLCQHHILLWK